MQKIKPTIEEYECLARLSYTETLIAFWFNGDQNGNGANEFIITSSQNSKDCIETYYKYYRSTVLCEPPPNGLNGLLGAFPKTVFAVEKNEYDAWKTACQRLI